MGNIPFILIAIRFLAGPFLVLRVLLGHPGPVELGAVLIYAIVSDIADGIIARHLGVATQRLRYQDSTTDLVFWLCALVSAVSYRGEIFREFSGVFITLLVFEVTCYGISFLRFKRGTATHAISAKVYGLALFTMMWNILVTGAARRSIEAALLIGIIANLDVIAILLLIPEWMTDIPSAYHAWQIRNGQPIKRHKIFN